MRSEESQGVLTYQFALPHTQVAQLESTIRSAHVLLQAGLIGEATSLHAGFRPKFNRTLPNAERW
jgi:hypothetical protein